MTLLSRSVYATTDFLNAVQYHKSRRISHKINYANENTGRCVFECLSFPEDNFSRSEVDFSGWGTRPHFRGHQCQWRSSPRPVSIAGVRAEAPF